MEGIYEIVCVSPKLFLGDVEANVQEIKRSIHRHKEAALILFPELSLCGYTLGDLFMQGVVEEAVLQGLDEVAEAVNESLVIVGAPLWHRDRLYNCAVVMQRGSIVGIVPKSYLANYREFYEDRWFSSGLEVRGEELLGAPFGTDLLFESGDLLIGVEICEDLWAVEPPSFRMVSAGANLICNLSASDELVGKHDYRLELVKTQSARGICAYAYASSGVGESSSDLCYSGATIIAENGAVLGEGKRFSFETESIAAQIDVERLRRIRRSETSFAKAKRYDFRMVSCDPVPKPKSLARYYDPHPFVPKDTIKRAQRCEEIFSIQASALARRILHIGNPKLIIGVSGGLDSTLALLVCKRACQILQKPLSDIVAISMPGPGTSEETKKSAKDLALAVGATFEEIDITEAVMKHLRDIGHDPKLHDVTYENAQARERTQILMDKANQLGGIVVGTGDLSEIALGFSTYNGDHMAMYNVNSGVPKTLVRFVIEWVATKELDLTSILDQIVQRPVSPELLPPKDGQIAQKTEQIIGPYELHDFFLYHFIKEGASPSKIESMAKLAFHGIYEAAEIKKWLRVFIKRFFANQFKRDAMPDGVKVGTIALSPRGDWRMPSDAKVDAWLKRLSMDEES
ncbi:MAG: NAD(+) synthase [Epsilonproteobacteria bacterium]|nr:NAD(+) synthase [Campylobacterota bacterium]NPA64790.1 NAD(+) synthase [Campylobacterota bacterium]